MAVSIARAVGMSYDSLVPSEEAPMLALVAALLLTDAAVGVKATIVQGTVEAKGPADADFAAVKAGSQIELPASIRTPAGGKPMFELHDAFELRVNEQTELLVESAKRMVLREGRVLLKVTPSGAPVDFATDLHPMKLGACTAEISYTPRVPNGPPAATAFKVLEGKMQAFSKK